MKTLFIVMFVSSFAFASCPKGSIEFSGGCAEMPSPSESTLAPLVPTSNEKPPSDKMPSYQREGVHAETPDSMIARDIETDKAKMRATIQGKRKSHTPLTDEEKAFLEIDKK